MKVIGIVGSPRKGGNTEILTAPTLLKEVVKQLLDEYTQSIKDITDEAILEMVSGEIQKMVKVTRRKMRCKPY